MSHILLNCGFLLFWSNLVEIHREFSFYTKSNYLRNEHWKTQKVCFSYQVWKGLILRKIWIRLNYFFLSNQSNGININKNCFSPQSELHTAKLSLSVVLNHFGGLSQKRALKISEIFFSYHVWKAANPEENLDLFKQLFLINQVKGDEY